MADPVSLGMIASVGITAGAKIVGAVGESQAAQKDADLKRLQADEAEKSGARQEKLLRQQGQQIEGTQVSGYAKAGLDLSGSPLLVLEDTARQVEEQALVVQHDTAFRAGQLRQGADLADQLGQINLVSGLLNAGGTVLGGAAKAYSPANTGPRGL